MSNEPACRERKTANPSVNLCFSKHVQDSSKFGATLYIISTKYDKIIKNRRRWVHRLSSHTWKITRSGIFTRVNVAHERDESASFGITLQGCRSLVHEVWLPWPRGIERKTRRCNHWGEEGRCFDCFEKRSKRYVVEIHIFLLVYKTQIYSSRCSLPSMDSTI